MHIYVYTYAFFKQKHKKHKKDKKAKKEKKEKKKKHHKTEVEEKENGEVDQSETTAPESDIPVSWRIILVSIKISCAITQVGNECKSHGFTNMHLTVLR